MTQQNPPFAEMAEPPPAGLARASWGAWILLVAALAAVGALSYTLGALAPVPEFTLPPATMLIFGFLAGAVHGLVWRRQFPPIRRWVLTSSLAGLLAAGISVPSTFLADTAVGLLAGWAFVWAAYGAAFGLMLRRISPRRWWMLVSLLGWAAAGIVSGAVAWALDVFVISETIPTTAFVDIPSRSWSMAGLAAVGAVGGAVGGAITGAAWAWLARAPAPSGDAAASKAEGSRLVTVAGIISGFLAATLSIYVAPLVITMLEEGSLDSLDLTIFFMSALYSSPVCLPAIAAVTIPLSIGCGYVGLEVGRAMGRPDSKVWIWLGAALGGVAGYFLGSLVAFSIASYQ